MTLKAFIIVILFLEVLYLAISFVFPTSKQFLFISEQVSSNRAKQTSDIGVAYNPAVLDKVSNINKKVTNWGIIENTYRGVILTKEEGANFWTKFLKIRVKGTNGAVMVFEISLERKKNIKVLILENQVKREGSLVDLKVGEWVEIYEKINLNKPLPGARERVEFTIDKGF